MKKITILLFFCDMLLCKAQQNEFLIGAFSPPNVEIGLTPCPGYYNSDGLVDLAVKNIWWILAN